MNRLIIGALVATAALSSANARADEWSSRHIVIHEPLPLVDFEAARLERIRLWQEELAAREREIVRAETAWRTPRGITPIAANDDRERSTFGNYVFQFPDQRFAYFRDPYYFMDGRSYDRRSLAFGLYANDFYSRWYYGQPRGGFEVAYPTPGEAAGERVGARIGRSIGGRDGAVIGSEVGRGVGAEIERR